jgi:hypothetical protein
MFDLNKLLARSFKESFRLNYYGKKKGISGDISITVGVQVHLGVVTMGIRPEPGELAFFEYG